MPTHSEAPTPATRRQPTTGPPHSRANSPPPTVETIHPSHTPPLTTRGHRTGAGSWEGAGHAGSGWLGGEGRVCGLACLPSAPPVAPSSACPLLLSFRWLVWLCFFFGGGGWLGCCGWPCSCAGVGAGVGVGVVGDGGRVAVVLWVPCVCAGPQASGSQGAGPGGADGGWLAAVVAWRLRGWLRLLVSVWVAWPGVGVRVGVFMAWADGVVGSVGVVGLCGCRVCVRRRRSGLGWGTMGDAVGGGDAGDAYGGVL